jgi:hypothetical protein
MGDARFGLTGERRTATTDTPAAALGTVAIVGGGCYGAFYAGQLERARARGAAQYRRILIVDRDPSCRAARELSPDPARELVVAEWGAFFDRFLDRTRSDTDGLPDAIVPSPLMPHLMYQWLVRRARATWPERVIESRPLEEALGTPYDRLGDDGTRYVSFADWICPVHCIEPATCPIIDAPRTWEMSDAVGDLVRRLSRSRRAEGPVLFVCRHRVYGVGMFDAAAAMAGARLLADAGASGEPVDLVVGTVSACHGAVSVLHLGAGA